MLISLVGRWCGFECRVSKFPLCASSYFHLYFEFVFLRGLLSVDLLISFIHLVFVTELDFQRKYPVVDRLKLTRKSYGKKTLNVQLFI